MDILLRYISLGLQIIILLLLLRGNKYAREKKLMRHGQIMALAVGLHTISIFAIMIPSLITNLNILAAFFSSGTLFSWLHVITGTLVWAWGVAIVVMWGFKSPEKMACETRKLQMWPVYMMWILALVLGIIVGFLYI